MYAHTALHYITLQNFLGGLSKILKDRRAQHATLATTQCSDEIAETNFYRRNTH